MTQSAAVKRAAAAGAASSGTDTAQRLRIALGHLSLALRPTAAGSAADLTPTRAAVLLNAVRNGRVRLADVAQQEGLNPTLLSRTVANLAQDGLLTRSHDDGDRRVGWIEATPAGQRLARRIRAQRTQAVQSALDELAPAAQAQLEAALPALEELAERMNPCRTQAANRDEADR